MAMLSRNQIYSLHDICIFKVLELSDDNWCMFVCKFNLIVEEFFLVNEQILKWK